MADNAEMENSPNSDINGTQLKRRGSGPENEETKRSRDSSDLPPEILMKIFLYLGFSDIRAARLCCKHWFHITSRPVFASKRIFKISQGELNSNHPAAEVISASKIENLHLEAIQFGDVDELFGQIGPNIKTLTLESVHFAHALRLTFTHFTNLQSLKVCNIRDSSLVKDVEYLPFGDLSRLKVLELTGNRPSVYKYLLDCSLCADSLEKLTLDFTKELEAEVLKLLDKQAEILKFLDLRFMNYLSDITFDVGQWTRIASKLTLKELSLGGPFSRVIMVEMIKNQKSLRSLNLEGTNVVDDEYLSLIVQKLPQLRRLFLDDCKLVKDIGVEQLSKLSKLTVLGLIGCNQITPDGIRSIINQEANIRLQELHMIELPYLNEDIICFCAKNLKGLRVLNLYGCHRAVTNKSVNEIFEHQRNLRDLHLANCRELTDFGTLDGRSIRSLERLSLSYCNQLSQETLCGLNAPQLKFLDIRYCLRVTSCGISALVNNCPAIEEIAFTYSGKMNEVVIDILTKGLSRLRTLTIDNCTRRDVLQLKTTDWKQTHICELSDTVTLRRLKY